MTAAPTPAPIAAFAPVASPCLMREPCETPATFSVGELLAEDEVEDEEDKGFVVYQCVDVMIVVTVLSLLDQTTTAVLVVIPAGPDVTTSNDDSCTEAVTCVAGVAYTEDVIMAVVVYVLDEDEVDGDTDEAMVEAAAEPCTDDALEDAELEAAAQATFRTDCTPLLSQFESNVSAAALHSLAMKHHSGELGGLTLLISTVAT
jgi:hypothetical protein